MDSWKLSQQQSLVTAHKLGDGWTLKDLELVNEWMDEPVAVVAELLQRSVYSICCVRKLLRDGKPVGSNRRSKPAEVAYDFVTTFPVGWND